VFSTGNYEFIALYWRYQSLQGRKQGNERVEEVGGGDRGDGDGNGEDWVRTSVEGEMDGGMVEEHRGT
jgi:hypothetical protein